MRSGNIMSRLAKKPIILPKGVTVSNDNNAWSFKGPKGEIHKLFHPAVSIEKKDDSLLVTLRAHSKSEKALLGTAASLVKNAINGVENGFEKKLEIEGIGYKAQLDGGNLVLSLGFTHPVRVPAPTGISFKVEKNVITINGVDKEKVGEIAAKIRDKKPPEPYKGKGIHYMGEVIRRKAGKKAVGTAA